VGARLVGIVLCAACWLAPGCARPAVTDNIGPAATPGASAAVTRVEALLRAHLAASNPGAVIKTSHSAGALGTTVVMAAIEGAYPGTGVARVVLDEANVPYGVLGDKSLADLARARGWLDKPPDQEAFLRLVNDTLFNGVAILVAPDPHALRIAGGELLFDFERHSFPTNFADPTRLRIGRAGPPVVESTAPKDPPEDPAASLEWALDKREAAVALVFLPKLKGRTDDRAMKAMARATTSENRMIAADAMNQLGPTPDAAKALKAAWATLPEARRRELVSLAASFFGGAFAATLE
jgi:hypothetical protein